MPSAGISASRPTENWLACMMCLMPGSLANLPFVAEAAQASVHSQRSDTSSSRTPVPQKPVLYVGNS